MYLPPPLSAEVGGKNFRREKIRLYFFLTFFNVNWVNWVNWEFLRTNFNFFYCIVFCIVLAFIKLLLYFILHFSYFTSYLIPYFFESKSILVLCKGRICTHRFILGQDDFLCFTGTVSKRTFNTWYSITQEIG